MKNKGKGPARSATFGNLLILGFLVLIYAVFALFAKNFFTLRSALNLLVQTSTYTIVGIASALVLIVGGIDFSLGAIIAVSGSMAAGFAAAGTPVWLSMIIGVAIGGAMGLLNASLIVGLRLPAFITTIGTSTIIYGFLSFMGSVARPGRPGTIPESFGDLGNAPVLRILAGDAAGRRREIFPGFSWIAIIMVLVAILFHFVLARTRIGRYAYIVGSNREAARLSGIRVGRVKMLAYVFAGLLSGLVGILLASRMVGSPGAASGYHVIGITCAMIGGASLAGGSGSIGGTVIGSFLISTLAMGLTMLNNSSPALPLLFNGLVILAAVYLDLARNREALFQGKGG